jgi:hypothetical protein
MPTGDDALEKASGRRRDRSPDMSPDQGRGRPAIAPRDSSDLKYSFVALAIPDETRREDIRYCGRRLRNRCPWSTSLTDFSEPGMGLFSVRRSE